MVAVVGGATAGAEVAARLAERGVCVVVFDRKERPYGKIEDGLPSWHRDLRRKEFAAIDEKLSRPEVHFVPNTALGPDVGIEELTGEWGFSAVVLAQGAWRDRPFPIAGADAYVGKGLVYQNPFIIAFNHADDPDYEGPRFPFVDGVLVVGGGLASIDVVKVLMLETTRAALAERGIDVPLVELEVKGIPRTLAAHGLAWEDLGLEGCTLIFRSCAEETTLVSAPPGADEARLEKVRQSRLRVLDKAMKKYCFKFQPCAIPDAFLVEDDRVVGLRLRRTIPEGSAIHLTDETFELRGAYVVSSIGSIPEPIPGLPMKGELFAFSDPECGRFAEFPTVFSVGNVVTGMGNIVASRNHARRVSDAAIERYLGLAEESAQKTAEHVLDSLTCREPLTAEDREALLARVAERQAAVGYAGDYRRWIESVSTHPTEP